MLAQHFALAFLDHVHAVAKVSLLEDEVASLKTLVLDAGFECDFSLSQLGRKDHVQEPVCHDSYFSVQAGHLHQVDAAPQEPCGEARDLDAENLGHGGAVSQRAKRAETF